MKINHYSHWGMHFIPLRNLLIMKFIFLFVFVFSLGSQASINAQTVNLTKSNASLVEIFREIKKQTGYTIICDANILKNANTVTVSMRNTPLKSALTESLRSNDLEYFIEGESIVVREKPVAKRSNNTLPKTETIKIQQAVTGTVTDAKGTIAGVTVSVKGSSTQVTSTDSNGKFSIQIPSGSATLVFNILGYIRQEIQVNNRSVIDVILQEEEQEMTEVVVVGYGTIVKKDLTSAVTSLKGKDLIAGAVNPIMAIQGKVAGLSVQSTNGTDPNAGVSLQLRGVNSLNAGMGPLVVIDGVPGGDINSVAKEDVESINILKDGSAASIYGTRASGGVILITTKQAKVGRTSVNLTSELFSESVRRKPELLSREEFLSLPNNAASNNSDQGGDTKWYDEVLNKNPLSQRYALNISGGSEDALIYATGTYRDAKGMLIESGRKEYSGRFNSIFKFFNGKAQLTNNVSYNHAEASFSNGGILNMAMMLNPTIKLYNPTDPTGYNVLYGGYDAFNPVAEVRLQKNQWQYKNLLASSQLKVNITSDLSTTGLFAIKNNTEHGRFYRSAQHRISRTEKIDGHASQEQKKYLDKTFEWTLNYNKSIDNHSLNAAGGYSYQEFDSQGFSASNSNFPIDGMAENDLGAGSFLTDLGKMPGLGSWRGAGVKLAAFFGRINYSYDNKYIFTASLRREGSSKFFEGSRWGSFPGISAAWRISEESFLKDVSFINDLKIRGGYGETGNADFNAITAYRVYSKDTEWLHDGIWIRTYGTQHNQNKDLRWEVKKESNIGIDFTVLNNKLSGRFDIYKRKIVDLIYDIDVPQPPYVHDKMLVNVGDMENKGIEFELNWNAIDKNDFTYTTGFVASTNKGKLVTLNGSNSHSDRKYFGGPGNPGSAIRLLPGQDLGNYFIWRSAGFTDDGGWLVYNKDNEAIPSEQKTNEDKVFIGNSIPKLTLSWNNSFTYKNFDASVYMRSWLGHDVFNMIDMYYGVNNEKLVGQNFIKSAITTNKHIVKEKELTDYWLEKGSFLKVDAISLGYTFKPDFIKNIKTLRAYVTGRDLLVLTKYSGLDPEVNVNGLEPGFEERSVYPKTRTLMLGVQIGF